MDCRNERGFDRKEVEESLRQIERFACCIEKEVARIRELLGERNTCR